MKRILVIIFIISSVPGYLNACDNAYINDAENRIIKLGYAINQFTGYDCANKLWKDLLKLNKSNSDPVKQISNNYRAVYFYQSKTLLEIWIFYDTDTRKYIDMIVFNGN